MKNKKVIALIMVAAASCSSAYAATLPTSEVDAYIRDSAANLGINCFIQNTKKLKQPSLMLLNTRYEALAAKFECIDTFEF